MLVTVFYCFQMSCSVCRALSWDDTPIPGILPHYAIKLCSAEIIRRQNLPIKPFPFFLLGKVRQTAPNHK